VKCFAKLISCFPRSDIAALVYRISRNGIILPVTIIPSLPSVRIESCGISRARARAHERRARRYSRTRTSELKGSRIGGGVGWGGGEERGRRPAARNDFPGKLSRRRGARLRMKKLFGVGYITDTRRPLSPRGARWRRRKNPRNYAPLRSGELDL